MKNLQKMLAVALLATLPLMASMCGGGTEAPQPEAAPQAPPANQPPAEVTVCRDSVELPVEVILDPNGGRCHVVGGSLPSIGEGPLGQPYSRIINTQVELEQLVHCQNFQETILPNIDFAKYSLLTGKMWTTQLGFPRNVKFAQACGEYRLNINLWPVGSALSFALSSYFVLVPKLPEGAKVKFNVYSKFCPIPNFECPK